MLALTIPDARRSSVLSTTHPTGCVSSVGLTFNRTCGVRLSRSMGMPLSMSRCEDCKREYERGKGWVGFVREYGRQVSGIPMAPVVLFYCLDCATDRFIDGRGKSNGTLSSAVHE